MMGSKSTTEIYIQQNQFYTGEQIKVTIKCDNSKCKTAIRNFKFKLFRQILSKDSHTGNQKVTEEKIFAKKEPGVEGNKSTKRDFVFDIPKEFKISMASSHKLIHHSNSQS